ncbi:MAG: AAA family ATPase [Nitrospirae bacterium]|nr:AAA family ATPase [Nitrospirota bacterium]
MYTKHFGLKILPFENVPDPVFFFDQGEHSRIRIRIVESLKSGRGLMVITGPIGSGKTTLSQMIKSDFPDNIKLIWMAEPPATALDLFMFIAQELGITPSTAERVFVLRDIKETLLKMTAEGGRCMLIIDESHLISDDTLNGIRLLNNLEEGSTKLIQILLLGQEELLTIINRPEMEPFRQRIATLDILGKMNDDRIREYISHRIQVAGGRPSIFEDTGWEAILLAFDSGGAPRVINSLCDRTLNAAFERNKSCVDAKDVYEAAKTLGIGQKVFHYIIALNTMERKTQSPSAGENAAVQKPGSGDNGSRPPSAGPGMTHGNRLPAVFQPAKKTAAAGKADFPREGRTLKVPALVLLSSLAALIAGLFFYCRGIGSDGLMTCMLELIGL